MFLFVFFCFFYLDTDAKIGDTAPYSRNFAKLPLVLFAMLYKVVL